MPEEPVIVTGGSVTVQIPNSFTQQTAASGQWSFTNSSAKLVKLTINGQDVATLGNNDTVEIVCEV